MFDTAVAFTLKEEGGATITNDPHDPGGLTKYGISKRAHPDLDIVSLTEDDAKQIYQEHYWDVFPMDDLPDRVAFILFDTAVNLGCDRAAKLLQRACGLTEDGIIGKATVNAAQNATIPERFMAERIKFYMALNTFGLYGTGWTRRVIRLAMAL